MPLRNRVTPFGEIVAIPERGTLMGNRGILHDADGQVRRRWAGRAWISCLLAFRGRRDAVMAPGHYTRLFFLDEPTAFAAGHRPCAFCRRADYVAFRNTWARANAHLGLGAVPRATDIDRVLHAERLGPGHRKRLRPADLAGLPDGVMVTVAPMRETQPRTPHARSEAPAHVGTNLTGTDLTGTPLTDTAHLVWQGRLWRWSPVGYAPTDLPLAGTCMMLTPPSVVATLAAGYPVMPPANLALA